MIRNVEQVLIEELSEDRGIADWCFIFEDTTVATAVLDRLLNHTFKRGP